MKSMLVRPGRNWELGENGEINYLLRKDMTLVARVWAMFIQDSLIPSSHKSKVREMALVTIFASLEVIP